MALESFVVGRPEHVRVRTDELGHRNRPAIGRMNGARNVSQSYSVLVSDQCWNRRANIRLGEGVQQNHLVAFVNFVHRPKHREDGTTAGSPRLGQCSGMSLGAYAVRVVILAQGKEPPSRAALPSPRRVIDVRADAVAADVEELRRDVDGDAACRALYP